MRKNLFYLFALIGSMSFFTACSSDNDEIKYPVEKELAGTYKGKMDVRIAGVDAPVAEGLIQKIHITKASDSAIKLELKNFSISMGESDLAIGDISVNKCELRQKGDIYSFTGNQTLNLNVGKCETSVSGTIGKGKVDMVIDVNVTGGQPLQVKVNYKGEKMTGNESSEAKILSFTFDKKKYGFISEQPVIDEESGTITFKVADTTKEEDLASLAPVIKVSEKATVNPASDVAQDFSKGSKVVYTVSAEDGTIRKYTVSLSMRQSLLKYDFNEWTMEKGKWPTPMPKDQLATANEGVAALSTKNFATVEEKDGYEGSAAKLVTLYTKGMGWGFAPAITPGSLFTGEFQFKMTLDPKKQLEMTKFGIEYTKKPLFFKGVYKYIPGENYVDGSDKKNVKENLEIKDECAIQAILYEAKDEQNKEVFLTGVDIKSSNHRVAIAHLKDGSEKKEWTSFNLPFEYLEGKSYDAAKEYKLAIICSSSKDGDQFKGAVNSTLIVDDFEIIGE